MLKSNSTVLRRYSLASCIIFLGILYVSEILAQGTWTEISQLPRFHGYVRGIAFEGKLYVFPNGDTSVPATTYVYDPTTDIWETKSERTTDPPSFFSTLMGFGVAQSGGKIYLIGGSTISEVVNVVQEYDPSNDTWTTKAQLPTPRVDLVAVTVDSLVYAIGGWNGDTANEIIYDVVETYNSASDTWETKATMPGPRTGIAASVVNNKIYVIGGGTSRLGPGNSVFIYDPGSDSWTTGADMPTSRTHASSAIVDNVIYVFGGTNGLGGGFKVTEAYNPEPDSWETMALMPKGGWDIATDAIGEKIYLAGGRLGPSVFRDAYVFTPPPPNSLPIVDLPDSLQYLEDESTTLDLKEFVTDANDADSSLTWTFSGNLNISISIGQDQIALFTALRDWNGTEQIVFTATDPQNASGSDTLTVTVVAVPDPPQAFHLMSPAPGDSLTSVTPTFLWQKASDPDEGDEIFYELRYGFDLAGTNVQAIIASDTSLAISAPLAWERTYFWTVRAFDRDSLYTAALDTFYFYTKLPFEKKVFAHYMGWYADSTANGTDSLRHWICGQANHPIIGHYDSRQPSLLTYHLLMAWACGIDGFVFNWYGEDSFENQSLLALMSAMDTLYHIDSTNFNLKFAVSYDDDAIGSLENNFAYLRDSIVTKSPYYLTLDDEPAIFIFNKDSSYEATDFRRVVDSVFASSPILVWNQSKKHVFEFVDANYPWVQASDLDSDGKPDWDTANGLEWGKKYLEDFYWRVNNLPKSGEIRFACGGVWPGFDDRNNVCWGENRWIVRQNGAVYDSTWMLVHDYTGSLPVPWVYLETWNDWNEGTEIEPSDEYGYQYLLATIENINQFKNLSISKNERKFVAAESIYVAHRLIETGVRDSTTYYHKLKNALAAFFQKDYSQAIDLAICIITTVQELDNTEMALPTMFALFQNYPNPFNPKTEIRYQLPEAGHVTLRIYNLLAEEIAILVDRRLGAGEDSVVWDARDQHGQNAASGIYFYHLEVIASSGKKFVDTKKMSLLR